MELPCSLTDGRTHAGSTFPQVVGGPLYHVGWMCQTLAGNCGAKRHLTIVPEPQTRPVLGVSKRPPLAGRGCFIISTARWPIIVALDALSTVPGLLSSIPPSSQMPRAVPGPSVERSMATRMRREAHQLDALHRALDALLGPRSASAAQRQHPAVQLFHPQRCPGGAGRG
jgi:hypothetical protein